MGCTISKPAINNINMIKIIFINNNSKKYDTFKKLFEDTSINRKDIKTIFCNNMLLTELPEEISQLTNLQVLSCEDNKLTELPKEISQLTNLQHLYCCRNKLTELPKEIGQLTNLQTLYWSKNKLTELPKEIGQLTNLLVLYCACNNLTEIPKEIGQLTNLEVLDCAYNQLTELPKEIGQLTNLQVLDCTYNQLIELPKEIGQLTNLQLLDCAYNQLTELPKEIGQLTNLQLLDCAYNQLTEIPIEIINCRYIYYIYYDNNAIIIHPVIQRFINRRINNNSIYNDGQNVHTSSIQESCKKSILNLLNDNFTIKMDKLIETIIDNPLIKNKKTIIKYLNNKDVHSTLFTTFGDIFVKVYGRIINSEHKKELFKRLNEEMTESECKCFTGRLTRIVNVLNGYFDDITINISSNEQISNIIIAIKNKYHDVTDAVKEEIRQALREREYYDETINLWLDNL